MVPRPEPVEADRISGVSVPTTTGGESTVGVASWVALTTAGDELQAASIRIAVESTNWLIINILLVTLSIL
jgi:hypothetical protein